jgi:hypothetical protein
MIDECLPTNGFIQESQSSNPRVHHECLPNNGFIHCLLSWFFLGVGDFH